jgi:hypothetical protein
MKFLVAITKRVWGCRRTPPELYEEEDRKVPSPYEWDGGISRALRALKMRQKK